MLDIKRIREDYEGVKERVEFRGKGSFGIENVKKYDEVLGSEVGVGKMSDYGFVIVDYDKDIESDSVG